VLTLFLIGIIAAGGVGSLAFGKLDTGGYSDLGSESAKAASYLTEKFKVQEPVAILVIDSGNLDIADPEIASAAQALENRVSTVAGVSRTIS
jgi:RND superfamily putative drug exporter